MKLPNPEVALFIYCTYTEINNAEIRELFSCNATTATRLKKSVQERMAETGVRTWRPENIDVKTAFKVWHIDVEQCEKRLAKLKKLRDSGVIREETVTTVTNNLSKKKTKCVGAADDT